VISSRRRTVSNWRTYAETRHTCSDGVTWHHLRLAGKPTVVRIDVAANDNINTVRTCYTRLSRYGRMRKYACPDGGFIALSQLPTVKLGFRLWSSGLWHRVVLPVFRRYMLPPSSLRLWKLKLYVPSKRCYLPSSLRNVTTHRTTIWTILILLCTAHWELWSSWRQMHILLSSSINRSVS
jgi:hypothetical protein